MRRRDYAQVARVRSRVLELDELSESMVNMVEKARELAQRKLMDSFIELIAQAIDDKSAYTGGIASGSGARSDAGETCIGFLTLPAFRICTLHRRPMARMPYSSVVTRLRQNHYSGTYR